MLSSPSQPLHHKVFVKKLRIFIIIIIINVIVLQVFDYSKAYLKHLFLSSTEFVIGCCSC
jgi:hypothetical protein